MNVFVLYFLVSSFIVVPPIVEGACNVVPIERWSGSSSGYARQLTQPVNLVVVTHTVTPECNTDAACQSIVNSIRDSHKRIGYPDIGLSFVVGGNGVIYEGAGWRVGAHTLGYNDRSISLSFVGEFGNKLPTEAALKAGKDFLECFKRGRYLHSDYSLMGHRQLVATISPGDALQNYIQTWPHWTSNVPTRPH